MFCSEYHSSLLLSDPFANQMLKHDVGWDFRQSKCYNEMGKIDSESNPERNKTRFFNLNRFHRFGNDRLGRLRAECNLRALPAARR